MSKKLKQLLIEKHVELLNLLDNKDLSNLAQDHNDKVGSELVNALKTTIEEYEQGVISHSSLLEQTKGICVDFENSLIDVAIINDTMKNCDITIEEERKALIKEAEKRGYNAYIKVRCLEDGLFWDIDDSPFNFKGKLDLWDNNLNACLYKDGQWAEIIIETDQN